MSVKLSDANLDRLPPQVARPRYRRAALKPGILHMGVGNFHRAHQAVYLDDLFEMGADHDWAIVGAGLMPADEAGRRRLAGQDWLTTVVEQEADASAARVTGAMIDYLPVADPAGLVGRLADPAIRIVSLTITEGGYFIDPASGNFNAADPAIVADADHPESPGTVFGILLSGLRLRRARGHAPFTIMSCDNLPGNGHVTEAALTGLAKLADPELAAWIGENVAFPNGMVDRITPATGDRERAIVSDQFGVADEWPVFCEGFRQWVVEDRFTAGRPALERVGVTFVDDVAPFELMKIRILNGGHAAIAYPAALMGIHFVHDAMAEPLIRGFLSKLEREEIMPVVPPVPGVDLGAYFRKVEQRFSNPKIADTIPRLCQDGSNRQPKFILPSAQDRLRAGAGVSGLALVSALWCRFCEGVTDDGAPTNYQDVAAQRLRERAFASRSDPRAFLGMADIYGEVGKAEPFRTAFSRWLSALRQEGTAAVLRRYLDKG